MTTALVGSTAALLAVPGVLGPLVESDIRIGQTSLGFLAAVANGGHGIRDAARRASH